MDCILDENAVTIETIINSVFSGSTPVEQATQDDPIWFVGGRNANDIWFEFGDGMNEHRLPELYVGIVGFTEGVTLKEQISNLQIMEQRGKYLEGLVPEISGTSAFREELETTNCKEFFYTFPLGDEATIEGYLKAVRQTVEFMTPTRSILLANQYKDIDFLKNGGTRNVYRAKFGSGDETRIIKEDLAQVDSPRAIRHTERGYNNAHEYQIMGLVKDWHVPQLNRMVDVVEYADETGSKILTVYDEFRKVTGETAEDLEEETREGFTRDEFFNIFSDSLKGLKALHDDVGVYHRDIKPSNILVRRDRKKTQAQITDYANAVEKDQVKVHEDTMPTMGGHHSLDPLSLEGKVFDETSDLYGLGKSMLFALTGEYTFEIDPDTSEGLNKKTGELLLINGELDRDAYTRALSQALEKIDDEYKPIFQRMLTLNESQRYKSVDAALKDVEKLRKETLGEKIKRNPLPLTITGILGATIMAIGISHNLREPTEYSLPEQFSGSVYDEVSYAKENSPIVFETTYNKKHVHEHEISDLDVNATTSNMQVAFLLREYMKASKDFGEYVFKTDSQSARIGQNMIYRDGGMATMPTFSAAMSIKQAIGISFAEQNNERVDLGDVVAYTLAGPNEVHSAMRQSGSYDYGEYSIHLDSEIKDFADTWLSYIDANRQ